MTDAMSPAGSGRTAPGSMSGGRGGMGEAVRWAGVSDNRQNSLCPYSPLYLPYSPLVAGSGEGRQDDERRRAPSGRSNWLSGCSASPTSPRGGRRPSRPRRQGPGRRALRRPLRAGLQDSGSPTGAGRREGPKAGRHSGSPSCPPRRRRRWQGSCRRGRMPAT